MTSSTTVWSYIDSRMSDLREEGRKVTADNYGKALRCLRRYCPEDSLRFEDITEEFVAGFNRHLKRTGIQKATVSFYNRVLRSLYNQAAREGLVKNSHPFDSAYTKVEPRLAPVRTIKSDTGEPIPVESLSKEELARRYRYVMAKYNTLLHELTAIVGGPASGRP